MSFKTIFIITVSVLVTVVLMNNTEEINFWIFGNARIPKLAVLGVMFVLGLIIGYMAGRPAKKQLSNNYDENSYDDDDFEGNSIAKPKSNLSDEDREYIS
ncbi:hypothetical protein [Daejeonella sp. H1SJ63]|jgi:hypothetical protein|uniref:hypothetical protein n=1 Tax=Daejeonella sp. H1SJ63 TaxID=3034145 RepID=UPI0023EB6BA1|nr:hypothetical protein [Daejeonella sp. H1SJ63]